MQAQGKKALITGASSGIGRTLSIELARAGYNICAVARNKERLESLKKDLEEFSVQVELIELDLSNERDFAQFETMSVDVLIHCAGIGGLSTIKEMDIEEWEKVQRVNVTAPVFLTKTLLPSMQSGSHIIFLGSIAAKQAFPSWGAYCSSKASLASIAAVLREELREQGVKVTLLQPGATATPFWEQVEGDWDQNRMVQTQSIARLIVSILSCDSQSSVDELNILPAAGIL
ncbi:MAG: hypothetical protein CMO81_06545 [Waddliaceae bacterium]|nr:hypothetical protein [Waddliaceae bacterium]